MCYFASGERWLQGRSALRPNLPLAPIAAAEVVLGPKGEALWIEIGVPGKLGPELVFPVGSGPDAPENPILQPDTGGIDGSRVMRVGFGVAQVQALAEVDASKTDQTLCIGTKVAEMTPLIHDAAGTYHLAVTRRFVSGMPTNVAAFNLYIEAV